MRIILVIIPLLLTLAASGIQADPTVLITDYTISPETLTPGDIGTITITLANTVSQTSITSSTTPDVQGSITQSETVTVPVNAFIESAILKTKDFEILNGWYERVGDIGPGQSTTLTFLVRAPASGGVYFPEVWVRIRNGESVKYPIPVNVNSRYSLEKQPMIQINRSVPDKVIPGEPFNISLDLVNRGLADAYDILVQVDTPNQSLTSLTPEQFFFASLATEESKHLDLSFATDPDVQAGIRQFPVTILYSGAGGSRLVQSTRIGVWVQGVATPGIAKVLMDPARVYADDPFTLVIRVENSGTDDATSVKTSVDLPFSGGKESFIGTIEPKNDAPAVFNLYAGSPGDYPYYLTLEYYDEWGHHSRTIPLVLSVSQKGGVNGLIVPIFLVLIACAGYLIWRRRSI